MVFNGLESSGSRPKAKIEPWFINGWHPITS